jgi:hypothetical protein
MVSALAVSGAVAGMAAQQRRVPDQQPAKQAIQVALKVGGQAYDSREPGRCTHAPVASIYQVMSELWSIQQPSGVGRSLSLTFWKPKNGSGEMVTLSILQGNSSHDVNTVRGGPTTGSGKVSFTRVDKGGTFTVDAKTQAGVAITGTIKCDSFAPHIAEGGL